MSWLFKVNESPFHYEIEGDAFYRANETHYRPVIKEFKNELYVGYDGYVSVFRKNGEWVKNIEVGRDNSSYNKSYIIRGIEFDDSGSKDNIIVCGNRYTYNYSQIFVHKYEIEDGSLKKKYEPRKINHSYVQGIVKDRSNNFIIIGTIWDDNTINVDDGDDDGSSTDHDCPTNTISGDCRTEYDNAIRNNNLASFYNRCKSEGGSNPLRNRCALCCGNTVTNTSERKKLHWQVLFLKLNNNCRLKNNGLLTIGKVDWDYATSVTIDDNDDIYISASIWLDSNSGTVSNNNVSGKIVTVNSVEIFAPKTYKYNVGIIYKVNNNGIVLWGKLLNDLANTGWIHGRKTIPTDIYYKDQFIYFVAYEYDQGVVLGKIDKNPLTNPEDPLLGIMGKRFIDNINISSFDYVLYNAYSIILDNYNNIFVGGYIKGKFNGKNNYGTHDFFIAKYDSNFNFKSVYQFGSNDSDTITDMIIDSNNDIYATGFTKLIGFSPRPTNVPVDSSDYYTTSTKNTEIFLIKNNVEYLGGAPNIISIDFTFGETYNFGNTEETNEIIVNLVNANDYTLVISILDGNTPLGSNQFTIENNIQTVSIVNEQLQIGGSSIDLLSYNNKTLSVYAEILNRNLNLQKDFFVKTNSDISNVTLSFDEYLNQYQTNETQTITVIIENVAENSNITVTVVFEHDDIIIAEFEETTTTTTNTNFTTDFSFNPVTDLPNLPEGQIDYTITVTDTFGNSDISNGFFIHDVTAEITNITFVGNYLNSITDNNDQTVTITLNGIDDNQTVDISLNDISYNGIVSGNSCNIDIPSNDLQNLPLGNNTIYVSVSDLAGNTDISDVSFNYDVSAEIVNTTITNTQENQGNLFLTNNTFMLSIEYEHIQDGEALITLFGDNVDLSINKTIIDNNTSIVDYDISNLVAGVNYNIKIEVTDEAGNEVEKTIQFTYDNSVPDISNVYYEWKVYDFESGDFSNDPDGELNAITDNSNQRICVKTNNVNDGKTVKIYFPFIDTSLNGTDISNNSSIITISSEIFTALSIDTVIYNITILNADNLSNDVIYSSSFIHNITPKVLNTILYDTSGQSLANNINKLNKTNGVTLRVYTSNAELGSPIDISLSHVLNNLDGTITYTEISGTTLSGNIVDKTIFGNINGTQDTSIPYNNSYGICDFNINENFFLNFVQSSNIETYRLSFILENDSGKKTNFLKNIFYDICAQILDDVFLSWEEQSYQSYTDISFNKTQIDNISITISLEGIDNDRNLTSELYDADDIINGNIIISIDSTVNNNSSNILIEETFLEDLSYGNYKLILNTSDSFNNEATKTLLLNYIDVEPSILIDGIEVSWSQLISSKSVLRRGFNLDEIETNNMRIVTNLNDEFITVNTINVDNGTASVSMAEHTLGNIVISNNTFTLYLDYWSNKGLVDKTKYIINITVTNDFGLSAFGQTFLFYDRYYFERGTIGFNNIQELCNKQCERGTTKILYKNETKKQEVSKISGKKYNLNFSGKVQFKTINITNTTCIINIDYIGYPESIQGILTNYYDNRNVNISGKQIIFEELYPGQTYNFKCVITYNCDLNYETETSFTIEKNSSFIYPSNIKISNPTNQIFESDTSEIPINIQIDNNIILQNDVSFIIQNLTYTDINTEVDVSTNNFNIELLPSSNYKISYRNFIGEIEYNFDISFTTVSEIVPVVEDYTYSNNYVEITFSSNTSNNALLINGINYDITYVSTQPNYVTRFDLSINTDYSFCLISSYYDTNNIYKSDIIELKTLHEENTEFEFFQEIYSNNEIESINMVLKNVTERVDISYNVIIEKDISAGSIESFQYIFGYNENISINVSEIFITNDTYKIYIITSFSRIVDTKISYNTFKSVEVKSSIKEKGKVNNVTQEITNNSTLIFFEDSKNANEYNVLYRIFNELIETNDSTAQTDTYFNVFIDMSNTTDISNTVQFTGLIPETKYSFSIRSFYNYSDYSFFYYELSDISYTTFNQGASNIIIDNKTNNSIEFNINTKYEVPFYQILTLIGTSENIGINDIKFIFAFSINENDISVIDVSSSTIDSNSYLIENNLLIDNSNNDELNFDIIINNLITGSIYNIILETYYNDGSLLFITDASSVVIENPYYNVVKVRGDELQVQFKQGIVSYNSTNNTYDAVTITHSTEKNIINDEPTIIFDNNYDTIFTIPELISNTKYYLTTYIGDNAVNVDIYQTKDETNAFDISYNITGYALILSNGRTIDSPIRNIKYNIVIREYDNENIVRQFINIDIIDTLEIDLNKNIKYTLEIFSIYNTFDNLGNLLETNVYVLNTQELLGESYFILKNEYMPEIIITNIENNSIVINWLRRDDISSNSFNLLNTDISANLQINDTSYNVLNLNIGETYTIEFISIYISQNIYKTYIDVSTLNEEELDVRLALHTSDIITNDLSNVFQVLFIDTKETSDISFHNIIIKNAETSVDISFEIKNTNIISLEDTFFTTGVSYEITFFNTVYMTNNEYITDLSGYTFTIDNSIQTGGLNNIIISGNEVDRNFHFHVDDDSIEITWNSLDINAQINYKIDISSITLDSNGQQLIQQVTTIENILNTLNVVIDGLDIDTSYNIIIEIEIDNSVTRKYVYPIKTFNGSDIKNIRYSEDIDVISETTDERIVNKTLYFNNDTHNIVKYYILNLTIQDSINTHLKLNIENFMESNGEYSINLNNYIQEGQTYILELQPVYENYLVNNYPQNVFYKNKYSNIININSGIYTPYIEVGSNNVKVEWTELINDLRYTIILKNEFGNRIENKEISEDNILTRQTIFEGLVRANDYEIEFIRYFTEGDNAYIIKFNYYFTALDGESIDTSQFNDIVKYQFNNLITLKPTYYKKENITKNKIFIKSLDDNINYEIESLETFINLDFVKLGNIYEIFFVTTYNYTNSNIFINYDTNFTSETIQITVLNDDNDSSNLITNGIFSNGSDSWVLDNVDIVDVDVSLGTIRHMAHFKTSIRDVNFPSLTQSYNDIAEPIDGIIGNYEISFFVKNDIGSSYNSIFQLIIYKGNDILFETGVFENDSNEWKKIIIKTIFDDSFENLIFKIKSQSYSNNSFYISNISLKRVINFNENTVINYFPDQDYTFRNDFTQNVINNWDEILYLTRYEDNDYKTSFSSTNMSISFWINIKNLRITSFINIFNIENVLQIKLLRQFSLLKNDAFIEFNLKTLFLLEQNVSIVMPVDVERNVLVTLIISGKNIKIYKNKELFISQTSSYYFTEANKNNILLHENGVKIFNLLRFRIFDRVILSNEIEEIYNNESNILNSIENISLSTDNIATEIGNPEEITNIFKFTDIDITRDVNYYALNNMQNDEHIILQPDQFISNGSVLSFTLHKKRSYNQEADITFATLARYASASSNVSASYSFLRISTNDVFSILQTNEENSEPSVVRENIQLRFNNYYHIIIYFNLNDSNVYINGQYYSSINLNNLLNPYTYMKILKMENIELKISNFYINNVVTMNDEIAKSIYFNSSPIKVAYDNYCYVVTLPDTNIFINKPYTIEFNGYEVYMQYNNDEIIYSGEDEVFSGLITETELKFDFSNNFLQHNTFNKPDSVDIVLKNTNENISYKISSTKTENNTPIPYISSSINQTFTEITYNLNGVNESYTYELLKDNVFDSSGNIDSENMVIVNEINDNSNNYYKTVTLIIESLKITEETSLDIPILTLFGDTENTVRNGQVFTLTIQKPENNFYNDITTFYYEIIGLEIVDINNDSLTGSFVNVINSSQQATFNVTTNSTKNFYVKLLTPFENVTSNILYINDTSKPTLTSDKNIVNEGDTFKLVLIPSIRDVIGARYNYEIIYNNITDTTSNMQFLNDELNIASSNGIFIVGFTTERTFQLSGDNVTQGGRTIKFNLLDEGVLDVSHQILINDTNKSETFTLESNKDVVNEGDTVEIKLTTEGVTYETVEYLIEGINEYDIETFKENSIEKTPSLNGNISVNSIIILTFVKDNFTDNNKTMTFSIISSNGDKLSFVNVIIQDTSLTPEYNVRISDRNLTFNTEYTIYIETNDAVPKGTVVPFTIDSELSSINEFITTDLLYDTSLKKITGSFVIGYLTNYTIRTLTQSVLNSINENYKNTVIIEIDNKYSINSYENNEDIVRFRSRFNYTTTNYSIEINVRTENVIFGDLLVFDIISYGLPSAVSINYSVMGIDSNDYSDITVNGEKRELIGILTNMNGFIKKNTFIISTKLGINENKALTINAVASIDSSVFDEKTININVTQTN